MFPTMWSSLDKNKTPLDSEIEKIPSFIFCKWLAGDYRTVQDANNINFYYDIPIINQYMMIKNKHAGKIRNIKYVKNDKDENTDILLLAKHFRITVEKAKEYLTLISNSELISIRKLYELKNK